MTSVVTPSRIWKEQSTPMGIHLPVFAIAMSKAMMNLASSVGAVAAMLTSLSYFPQVMKAWPPGSTDGLSLKTLMILTSGLTLWIVYGMVQGDWIIVGANGLGAALSFIVLLCKLRDQRLNPDRQTA